MQQLVERAMLASAELPRRHGVHCRGWNNPFVTSLGRAVAFCRFLAMDRYGRVVRAHEQDCDTDDDIRAAATRILETSDDRVIDVEAWTGEKMIMRVER